MNPGKLSRRVTFQTRSVTQDAYGGQSTQWTVRLTAWAKMKALTGRELEAAQSMHAAISHEVIVYYQAALAVPATVAAMRIAYQGRIFDIHAAINIDERNEYVQILCGEGLNNG